MFVLWTKYNKACTLKFNGSSVQELRLQVLGLIITSLPFDFLFSSCVLEFTDYIRKFCVCFLLVCYKADNFNLENERKSLQNINACWSSHKFKI